MGCNPTYYKAPLVDFENLTIPSTPNYCIVKANQTGKLIIKPPVFSADLNALKYQWIEFLKLQPRLLLLKHEGNKYQYVQRSRIFHFPDLIDLEFVAIDAQHASVKIFSRSIYGYSDFGVNYKRVQTWLAQISQRLDLASRR